MNVGSRWLVVAVLLTMVGCNQSSSSSGNSSASASSATSSSSSTPPPSTPATEPGAAATQPNASTAAPASEVTMPDGLKVQDVVVGTGKVADTGMSVVVHYTGWLTDGTKFDSSVDRGQPLTFSIGAGQVIRGWDEGIKGMHVGGKRKLTIP